jgi:5'-deoxynucleotidase YfbR-like HD superfamily hydrolase
VCRFGGHCPQFYSVAEHCIHATALACSEGYTGDALIAVFLHDAAEAYIGDMVKPLKVTMPQYGEAEQRIEAAIQAAFGVDFTKWMDVIKRFDRAMLKAEKVTMWPEDTEKWAGFSEIEDRVVKFQFWEPSQAEMQFLAMARMLQLVG